MSKMPRGLPPVKDASEDNRSALEKARICPSCNSGKAVRIVSNQYGVNAICGPCKRHWPISSAPMAPQIPVAAPRGLSKQTLVEPDWDKAFEPEENPE